MSLFTSPLFTIIIIRILSQYVCIYTVLRGCIRGNKNLTEGENVWNKKSTQRPSSPLPASEGNKIVEIYCKKYHPAPPPIPISPPPETRSSAGWIRCNFPSEWHLNSRIYFNLRNRLLLFFKIFSKEKKRKKETGRWLPKQLPFRNDRSFRIGMGNLVWEHLSSQEMEWLSKSCWEGSAAIGER